MSSYTSHLLQHIRGNASQARLKCIAKCDAIPDKLCPVLSTTLNDAVTVLQWLNCCACIIRVQLIPG